MNILVATNAKELSEVSFRGYSTYQMSFIWTNKIHQDSLPVSRWQTISDVIWFHGDLYHASLRNVLTLISVQFQFQTYALDPIYHIFQKKRTLCTVSPTSYQWHLYHMYNIPMPFIWRFFFFFFFFFFSICVITLIEVNVHGVENLSM